MGIESTHDMAALCGATIVFDLDGTIADTAPDLIAAVNAALATEGFEPATADAIKPGAGYGTKTMLRLALISLGRECDAPVMERLATGVVSYYANHIAERTALFPGFESAANDLRRDGARLTLCTNKPEHLARKLLDALGIAPLFSAIAGRDTFPFHKPDPRHLTELLRLAGSDPGAAVMVGDSEADMAAAASAKIPAIAVAFGYAAVPAAALGANAVLGHFDELPGLVRGILEARRRMDDQSFGSVTKVPSSQDADRFT